MIWALLGMVTSWACDEGGIPLGCMEDLEAIDTQGTCL